jgi:hypothetical protein
VRRARLLALSAALAALFAGAGCGDDDDDGGNGSFVSSSDAPYTVTLPEGWTEPGAGQKELVAAQIGARVESAADQELDIPGVTLTSYWSEGDPSPERPSAIVIREPVPSGLSDDEFVQQSIRNAEQIFGDALTEPITPVNGVELAGEAAQAFDYTAAIDATLAKRVVFAIRNGEAYTLTLTSTPDAFDGAASDLDEILASWSWNE